jgi:hypothetical protein
VKSGLISRSSQANILFIHTAANRPGCRVTEDKREQAALQSAACALNSIEAI